MQSLAFIAALYYSLVLCLSQAEDEIFVPLRHLSLDDHRIQDLAQIIENNPQNAIPEKENDVRKDRTYYSFINNQDEEETNPESQIRILSKPQEVLPITDPRYKMFRDFFHKQIPPKDMKLSNEGSEEEVDTSSEENTNSGKIFTKLLKDAIAVWPIHANPERKISMLGKSIWKKKNHNPEQHESNIENILNATQIPALKNVSMENPVEISVLVSNATLSFNVTTAGDTKVVEVSTIKSMGETSMKNETEEEKKENDYKLITSDISISSFQLKNTKNESDLANLDENSKVVADSQDKDETVSKNTENVEVIEKEPLSMESEPLHQSFLYKSHDFRPVKFFPQEERDFIVSNSKVHREKESPGMFRNPLKESAGPDLFPSSVFEDEVNVPFFYVDS